eukprot:635118-Pelagomonas_calceolata.AAC.1
MQSNNLYGASDSSAQFFHPFPSLGQRAAELRKGHVTTVPLDTGATLLILYEEEKGCTILMNSTLKRFPDL